MDGDCVESFENRVDAEIHVFGCRGVLVVSVNGGEWEEVE